MPSTPLNNLMLDLLYHKQGSIMGYCTSLKENYLQGCQLNLADIRVIGNGACTPYYQKKIPGLLLNQKNNNIIISVVAFFMLPTTFRINKIKQQGLA